MKKSLTLLSLLFTLGLQAQLTADSVNTRVNKIDKFLDVLREFRIQMYVQPQFQYADTAGAAYAGGGDFPVATNNRFMLRRGRLRLSFEHNGKRGFKIIETAFQMDATERGIVIKDFYGRIIDPWTGWVGLQGGLFNRPFGFEIPYSDAVSESPERARLSNIVFPGERDLGYELIFESPSTFKPVYLRLEAGLFNGTGTISEIDKRKDFIGGIHVRKTIGEKTKFTIGGGVSYYRGGVLNSTPFEFDIEKDTTGSLRYTKITDSVGAGKKVSRREYIGADLQASVDYSIGTTTLRAEFVSGRTPGIATSSATPTTLGNDIFDRKCNGLYAYFVQTFKHKTKTGTMYHDLVFKYDWYDPNTQLGGKSLSTSTDARDSKADIKYQTFGVGYIFRPVDWFKLMVYYDIVKNEVTNVPGFTRDLKDNVLTLRTQFNFDTRWFVKK